MEKRLILFIAISTAVLVLYLFAVQMSRGPSEPAKREVAPSDQAAAPEPVEAPKARSESRDIPRPDGQEVVVDTELYQARLTTAGAGLTGFRLLNYREKGLGPGKKPGSHDLKVLQNELVATEAAVAKKEKELARLGGSGGAGSGEQSRLDGALRELDALAVERDRLASLTRAIAERRAKAEGLRAELASGIADEKLRALKLHELRVTEGAELISYEMVRGGLSAPTIEIPLAERTVSSDSLLFNCPARNFELNKDRAEGVVEFTVELAPGMSFVRRYHFSNTSYEIRLEMLLVNSGPEPVQVKGLRVGLGPALGLYEGVSGGRYSYGSYETPVSAYRQPLSARDIVKAEKAPRKGSLTRSYSGEIRWTALRTKYFAFALIPMTPASEVTVHRGSGREQSVRLALPGTVIKPQESARHELTLFMGPQAREELAAAPVRLTPMLDVGWLGPIAHGIHVALEYIHRVIPNYGWAILVLCLGIKLVLHPITRKSYAGMKKWQDELKKLQPKIEALKEKYKNNPQKLNKETMGLYRREGLNPLTGCRGGCLPMVFQMPVFFALYRVLNTAIELRNSSFGWVPDLSEADPLKILPILMGVSMIWQQKATGMGPAGSSAGSQQQAKIMAWMMPIIFTVMFLKFPSGVVLYWLGFNVFTSIQPLIKLPWRRRG